MNRGQPYPRQYRPYIETSCSQCGAIKMRRADMKWAGKCRPCATKEVAARPEIRAMMSRNGKLYPPPRQNVKNYRRGPLNNLWRGGITPAIMKIRLSAEMKQWRKAVFERDNFTCQICLKRGGELEADHIQPFSLFPELRFELTNGRALCVSCHHKHGARVSSGVITRPATFSAERVG